MIETADVSHWETVKDWTQVKHSEELIFMKATQALDFVDPKFNDNWKAAAANGIPRGAYHVLDESVDPVLQAQFFLNTVGALGPTDKLALDWEESVNKTGNKAACLAFANEVVRLSGKRKMLYGSKSAIEDMGFTADEIVNIDLWEARYTGGTADPGAAKPWPKWTLWQYTDRGQVPGIGNCDRSYFNGSESDFQQFLSEAAS